MLDNRPGGRRSPHDQHTGHGQRTEDVEQVALFQHRLVAVYQVTDSSLGQLHTDLSLICDVQPTTGVRCTGRLSGHETGIMQVMIMNTMHCRWAAHNSIAFANVGGYDVLQDDGK